MIELDLLQGTAPVVGAVVNAKYLQMFFKQRNGRQYPIPVQAVRVEFIGLEVGRGDKPHTVVKQRHQQAMQNHGVRNVCHMKLVKANQSIPLRNAFTEFVKGIHRALQVSQFPMYLAHELMKMQPGFASQRHGIEKAVHQKAFAPPYTPVQIDTTGRFRVINEFFERVGALFLQITPLGSAALQRIDGSQLRRV